MVAGYGEDSAPYMEMLARHRNSAAVLGVILDGLIGVQADNLGAAFNSNTKSLPAHLYRRSFQAINTGDPLVNSSNFYNEFSKPQYGLWVWTNIGRLTRLRLRNGGVHMPLPVVSDSSGAAKTVTFDQDALKMYFLPLAVFIGILILIFLMTCGGGCCIWFTRKTRLQRTQKKPYSFGQKARTAVSLTAISLFWIGAIAWGLSGAQYLDRSIYIFSDSTEQSFWGLKDTVTNFSGTVNDTTRRIENGTSAYLRTAAHFALVQDRIAPVQSHIATLVNSSRLMGDRTNDLLGISMSFMSEKGLIAHADDGEIAKLQTALSDNNDAATLLTTPVNFDYAGVAYQYKWNRSPAPDQPDPAALDNLRDTILNSDSLNDLLVNYLSNMPDITGLAVSAQDAATDLAAKIEAVQEVGIAAVQGSISSTIDSRYRMDIIRALGDLNVSIDGIRETTSTMSSVHSKYYLYKWFALGILFSLPALILITVYVGIGQTRPAAVRCCLCGALPYTLLAIFLTIILLCLSVLLGEACTIMFDRSDNGTAPMTTLITSINVDAGGTYAKALLARDSCISRRPFLSILDGVKSTTALNYSFQTLPAMLGAIVDSEDFRGVAESMTVESVIGEPGDISVAPLIATGLSSIVGSYSMADLTDLRTAITSLRTDIQTIIDSLHGTSTEKDSDDYAKVQVADITTNAVLPDPIEEALERLQRRMTAVRTVYIQIRDTELEDVLNKITALEALRTSMDPALTAIHAAAVPIPSDFHNVNTTLSAYIADVKPTILDRIELSRPNITAMVIDTADSTLNRDYRCDAAAIHTVDVEMAVCDGALTGFDGIWFSFLVLGVTGGFTLPVFLSTANRLADKNADKALSDRPRKAVDLSKRRKIRKGLSDVEEGQVKWALPKEMHVVKQSDVEKSAPLSNGDDGLLSAQAAYSEQGGEGRVRRGSRLSDGSSHRPQGNNQGTPDFAGSQPRRPAGSQKPEADFAGIQPRPPASGSQKADTTSYEDSQLHSSFEVMQSPVMITYEDTAQHARTFSISDSPGAEGAYQHSGSPQRSGRASISVASVVAGSLGSAESSRGDPSGRYVQPQHLQPNNAGLHNRNAVEMHSSTFPASTQGSGGAEYSDDASWAPHMRSTATAVHRTASEHSRGGGGPHTVVASSHNPPTAVRRAVTVMQATPPHARHFHAQPQQARYVEYEQPDDV